MFSLTSITNPRILKLQRQEKLEERQKKELPTTAASGSS
jgi:hypothetical protein